MTMKNIINKPPLPLTKEFPNHMIEYEPFNNNLTQ